MIVEVKKGDTLAAIAGRFHTTEQRIAAINALGAEPIQAGMRLLVEGYLVHLWCATDTLEEVAARYGVGASSIKDANHAIRAGEYIKIPI